MSTAISTADLDPAPGDPVTSVDNNPPESRGETRIEPKVVEKIAAQSVREITDATGSARRILGVTVGSTDQDSGANVRARVDGSTATVEVTMTVIYPASVREVTQRTRHHIRERVQELTGVLIHEVDITVAGMRVTSPDSPRVR